jgi:inorganic pyrophosphatase
MASNIWKEIPPGNEKEVNAVIEIPKGSRNKYEYDIDNGIFILDRVLFTPFHYPVNYAFIPQTWSTDEDPADIMVLSDEPIPQGTLVKCRPVAFLKMIDGGDKDDKILAVPVDDIRSKHIRDKDDVPPHLLEEILCYLLTLMFILMRLKIQKKQ